jgi:hypothetical protein
MSEEQKLSSVKTDAMTVLSTLTAM